MPVACPMRQTAKGNGGHSRIPPHAADLRIDRSGHDRPRPLSSRSSNSVRSISRLTRTKIVLRRLLLVEQRLTASSWPVPPPEHSPLARSLCPSKASCKGPGAG